MLNHKRLKVQMKNVRILALLLMFVALGLACNQPAENKENTTPVKSEVQMKLEQYMKVKLTTDLSVLTEKERQMIPLLLEVAQIMDDIFWKQSWGNKEELLNSIQDSATREFALINYGPWDRLDDNKPFVAGNGAKPAGAGFYPVDMDSTEFANLTDKNKNSQYTIIQRDGAGKLVVIPYHVAYKAEVERAAELLNQAAALAEDAGLKKYLELRAKALLTDDYFASDMAWMDMKTNMIDFICGPIENYEDALYGIRAAHESFLLVKDKEWSTRLEKYAKLLPVLQEGLPVEAKYKKEKPGSNSDLNAYDVLYYAGDCNSGGKTIAINLPNDEKVQLEKGSRRLQLKNAMKAKFDFIMMPISDVLISADQRKNVTFDAFFANVMFHEVAHGLGIKNTLDGKGTVRDALKDQYSGLEEGKADILGLYMVTKLVEMKELELDLMDSYVTFMAGIFRSIRFGGASAHGKANLVRFYYFKERGAFIKNADGTYSINFEKMKEAMNALSADILKLQGDGDYDGVVKLFTEKGKIDADLQADLDKLNAKNIPIDIVFEQGKDVLGLK